MGIEREDYSLIKTICAFHGIKGKVLILGDCHYHFTHQDIGLNKVSSIQTDIFIQELNFDSVETIDIAGEATHKLNLAEPLPLKFHSNYDLIIDAGTLCCCFDVPSVLKNIHQALKLNGHIIHISYFSGYYGRGYYNFHPNFFQDYYQANQYKLISMHLRKKNPYQGILRKFFKDKYEWRLMPEKANYFDGNALVKKYQKDPKKILNNMILSAHAQKLYENPIVMPYPLVTSEAKDE